MLDASGIQIVTVSTDTAGEIRAGQAMHGLDAIMLADPQLEVIDQFGLRNKNVNNFKIPGRPGLPVPTTLLVDGGGEVVWKDQSDNFTRRSHPKLIGDVVAEVFPNERD
jgi:peroxiredoxin